MTVGHICIFISMLHSNEAGLEQTDSEGLFHIRNNELHKSCFNSCTPPPCVITGTLATGLQYGASAVKQCNRLDALDIGILIRLSVGGKSPNYQALPPAVN